MEGHIHTGGTEVLKVVAIMTVTLVLARTWAAHHPDSSFARAVGYIYG